MRPAHVGRIVANTRLNIGDIVMDNATYVRVACDYLLAAVDLLKQANKQKKNVRRALRSARIALNYTEAELEATTKGDAESRPR